MQSGHVQMYAPSPQQPGSSVSHFDTAVAPNELMEPFYTGATQDVGLALEVFADLGWQNSPLSNNSLFVRQQYLDFLDREPGFCRNLGLGQCAEQRASEVELG